MLYRCWTKGTKREAGEPRRSANWLASRRGWLEFHPERVDCGDWSVAYSDVERATLYKMRQLFIPVSVLELSTADETFQFGLNPWVDPMPHLPLEVRVERARLGYSGFSVVVRVALALALLLWLWLWQRLA